MASKPPVCYLHLQWAAYFQDQSVIAEYPSTAQHHQVLHKIEMFGDIEYTKKCILTILRIIQFFDCDRQYTVIVKTAITIVLKI